VSAAPFPQEWVDGTYLTDEHGLYRVLAANRRTFEVWLEDCMEPECTVCTTVPELIGFRVTVPERDEAVIAAWLAARRQIATCP
jgi:hypothetical protein